MQSGPGGKGVVTIRWDNSSRHDIVQASEVILLTADKHPPDDIPQAGDGDVTPGSEAKDLFEDSEDIKDPANKVADEPQEAAEPQEVAKPQEAKWCEPDNNEGWGRPRPDVGDLPLGDPPNVEVRDPEDATLKSLQ